MAYSSASELASANQKWFSPSRSMTGSLTMPPSGVVMSTYLPWPTAHFDRSRGVSSWAKRNPSRPVTSSWRSTATSQRVTWLQQVPVLGLEIVEVDGEEHVVVDRVPPRAVGLLRLVEGRLAQPRATLDQAHVERHLLNSPNTGPMNPTFMRRGCPIVGVEARARALRAPTTHLVGTAPVSTNISIVIYRLMGDLPAKGGTTRHAVHVR